MQTTPTCPRCHSTDVMFSKKRKLYICEEENCGNEFVLEQEISPLRVFLSYGRDEYSDFAERLKADLAARGHEVWFDKEALKTKTGRDWEAYIDEGLNWVREDVANGRVVFVMTPHSVRRPDGYCLNEIAKALSLSVSIIPIMLVYCEPPLSVYRLQYLDMQECFPPEARPARYADQLERLVLALEDRQLDFQGTQSRFLKTLEPISFSADISRLLEGFTGRQWVFAAVDGWLQDSSGSKVFWLCGGPGVGKSAIAAWVRDHRREVGAFHFCDIHSEEKRNPLKLVRSIAYQLSTQLPDYAERLQNMPLEAIIQEYHEAYTLFDKLIIQPMADNFPAPDRTIVILIDALDEATYQKRNEICLLISRCAGRTPSWLRFFITSRPEPDIMAALQSLAPYRLDTSSEENLEDIRRYLRTAIPHITPTQIGALLERSEGVFLYIRHVCAELESGRLDLDRIDQFPRGLADIYRQFFDRQFGREAEYYNLEIRPLLCIILASFEPLSLAMIRKMLSYSNRMELFDRLDRLGSLFPRTSDEDGATISPFHRSLSDWLTDKTASGSYYIDHEYGHRLLVDQGWGEFERDKEAMSSYLLKWLPSHLLSIESGPQFIVVVKDFEYLMAKTRAGMLEQVLADYRELTPRLPENLRRTLRVEEAFFRERSHILRRGDDDWPAYKILLQLAVEHADNSPLTIGAERFLAEEKCDWVWLRREMRPEYVDINKANIVEFEGHTAEVNGVNLLPDGRILSWSEDRTLRFWANESGMCLTTLEGHSNGVRGALVLADGRILSWSLDYTLRIWDGNSGQCLAILEGHSGFVLGALVLADGRILSWSRDETLRLWDGDSGYCVAVLDGHTLKVDGALVLADGRILSWSTDKTLRLWDSNSGNCLAILEGHSSDVTGALALADGRILSWSQDKTLRLWDVDSGRCLASLEGHTERVDGAFALAGGRILSWALSNFRIWDVYGGHCQAILEENYLGFSGVLAFSDDRILSMSRPDTLKIWDSQNGHHRQVTLKLHGSGLSFIDRVLVATDGHILAWSRDENDFGLWGDLTNQCVKRSYEGHSGGINGVLYLDDSRILSWSKDRTLRIWDGASVQCLAILEGHDGWIEGAMALSDYRILSWSHDKTLRLWDSNSGNCLAILEGHSSYVIGALVLDDGRILSWSQDKTLRLWDVDSGQCLASLEGHTEGVGGAFALAGGRILSWSLCSLRLWDVNGGHCLMTLESHSRDVKGAIALSEGKILSWSSDASLRLWDGTNGQCLAILKGHSGSIIGALSLHDNRILSWAQDNTLRIWDSNSGQCLAILEGHIESVEEAIVLADNRILSWSWDRLRIWDGATGECLAILEGHSGRIIGALALSKSRVLSWSTDEFRIWEMDNGRCLAGLDVDLRHFIRGAFFLSDDRILSWSKKSLGLWDSYSGLGLATLDGGNYRDVNGAFALIDERILFWSKDFIRLWDGKSGNNMEPLEGHSTCVKGAHVLANGRILSWSGDDRNLRLWDSNSGQCQAILPGHSDGVYGALVLSDGKILSWEFSPGTLRIWDVDRGLCLTTIHQPRCIDRALVLRNNHIVSWWSICDTLSLWDGATGKSLAILEGHTDCVKGALALVDSRILSWSMDSTLRIWDGNSGKCLAILEGHTASIGGAIVLPDGRILSACNEYLIVWSPEGNLLEKYDNELETEADIFSLPTHLHEPLLEQLDPKQEFEEMPGVRIHMTQHGDVFAVKWRAFSDCTPRHLFDDGRVVVTQDNGQICVLKVYRGKEVVVPEAVSFFSGELMKR